MGTAKDWIESLKHDLGPDGEQFLIDIIRLWQSYADVKAAGQGRTRPPFFTDPPLDEPEIVRLLETAADNIELSLARVHLYKTSSKIQSAVERLGADTKQLLTIFPNICEKLV